MQITHIQFLTLLFPSKLERRLIYTLLGPLAIASAVMQVMHIRNDDKLVSICSAVQNICNATLSLLFTTSLFLWGTLVNRKQAWRTDGGTAAFGAGAMTLALLSSAITFLYIPSKNQFVWMPGLMWSVVLWQSFLGWWWWVGAGMGVGEVDELLRRAEKRRRKVLRKRERRERAWGVWRGVAGVFGWAKVDGTHVGGGGEGRVGRPDVVLERVSVSSSGNDASMVSASTHKRHAQPSPAPSSSASTSSTKTTTPSHSRPSPSRPALPIHLTNQAAQALYRWFTLLRHAHLLAARAQAVERTARISQAYGSRGRGRGRGRGREVVGWGLGSFGLRRELDGGEREGEGFGFGEGDVGLEEMKAGGSRSRFKSEEENGEEGEGEGEGETEEVDEWRDEDAHDESTPPPSPSPTSSSPTPTPIPSAQARAPPSAARRLFSLWWWGPLQRWRLQDDTVY